ncbi:MAG: FAD-dependent oxidoreductase [Comamonadaceae bacterium]|jgi:D-amino-acid dehydrogenase|uniref:FAD-dependent oxidoreductase n=1 Tax=Hydrogenophaga borbori TaxID=2294117 RepID=A0A372EKK7_9BURK|nr:MULTISPECIES: FAD-dependent oxidoreductase [Hydrogenophaga]NCT99654.1 FAD-dependent oxidoreductase [Comamonadaceae bacterium]RFP79633.1 FAD-dependent oxidoreductase [Hydrogenophaga borbori]WQB84102.1 FAD-dependent oxidoreductase [Hydrogenophaga sp. SNF1]
MHIAVIGTGIVGACSAAWLQRDGHQITFVDPLEPGEACSFGNAGSLSPSACLPVGMPGMWRKVPKWLLDPLGPLTVRTGYLPRVLPWLVQMLRHSTPQEVTRIATALQTLLRPIFDCYGPLLDHAQANELVRRTGCLYVYSSREAAAQWKWGMDLRRSLGVNLVDVEREALEELEPDLKGQFRFGILAPDNGSTLDPSQLVKALVRQALRDGARHDHRSVTGFEREGRRVTGLRLDSGEPLAVDGVVIAAGAWSGALAAQLGDRVPLETQRGYHVTVRSSNLKLRHTVMASEANLMINPMAMGLRLAGTVEFAGLRPAPNYERAQALLRQGLRLFPHLDTSEVTQWMGHRPCMPDSLPVIDRSRGADNAWMAFGHGHMGMCMGATTGREVAHLVAGRATQVDLAPFRASRFR